MSFLICAVAGIVAGVSGGLFGLGGGVIIVPFLVLALKFDQHKAQGTSLLALSLPVAGLGAYNYYREGHIQVHIGLLVALGMVLGSYIGSRIAVGINPRTMRRAFCGFLFAVAAYLFFESSIVTDETRQIVTDAPWQMPVAVLAGVVAGMSGGLFGVGGGAIIVPFFVLAFAFPQHVAQGTSLMALSLPVAAIGAYHYYKDGSMDVQKGLWVSLGVLIGSFLGSQLALGLSPVVMQRSFSVFVVAMAAYLFLKTENGRASKAAR